MSSIRMTIDDLAHEAGTHSRNIRNYQTRGLLPPPERIGHTGYYHEGHLARLRHIGGLQDRGFSLAAIGDLLAAWEDGRSIRDVLGLEEALTRPWSEEPAQTVGAEQLFTLFPDARHDPRLLRRAVDLGLVVEDGPGFKLPVPGLIRIGAEVVAAGVPLHALLELLTEMRADVGRIADRYVALFERYVWEPFAAAGMPAKDLPRVTDILQRLRPFASGAAEAELARAMDERVAVAAAAAEGGVLSPKRRSSKAS